MSLSSSSFIGSLQVKTRFRSLQLLSQTSPSSNEGGERHLLLSPAGMKTCRRRAVEYLGPHQQIYGVNRSGSVRVWDSELKSSPNISRYRKAALHIPARLSSDEPYMERLSDPLSQERTADLMQLVFIQSNMRSFPLLKPSYMAVELMKPELIMSTNNQIYLHSLPVTPR